MAKAQACNTRGCGHLSVAQPFDYNKIKAFSPPLRPDLPPPACSRFLRIYRTENPLVMAESPMRQPYAALPEVDPDVDDGFHWSDVELCLAALPECMQRTDALSSTQQANALCVALTNLGDHDYLTPRNPTYPHTYTYGYHHAYPGDSTCQYEHYYQQQQALLDRNPPSRSDLSPRLRRHNTSPPPGHASEGLYSAKSIGHQSTRQLDELFAVPRKDETTSYVHRPLRVPPSGLQIMEESQAHPDMLSVDYQKREMFRRRKWVAVRDLWPSFTSVVIEERLHVKPRPARRPLTIPRSLH
ncbi:hypothetical protein BXZ70DRAFT_52154 [Cristinia sonorae]|uniref:Uncharacterized protein n=1 Tax=Cristinia sonorae TaxID=1940300 RepID=A0A8K0XRB9_9AGAR|nr:hypothetical protein BXZ70DRAFT_52154 [Cristinia sonorae]